MRVAFDLTILGTDTRVRGIGRYLAELARAMAPLATERGIELHFIEELSWSGAPKISRDADAVIARLTDRSRPPTRRASWGYRTRTRMAAAVRGLDADLFHLGAPSATPIGTLGCPKLVTCHDLIPLIFPDQYTDIREGGATGRMLLDRRRYTTADHIIAISEATARDLTDVLRIPTGRITVVHNGIDLSRWSPEAGERDVSLRDGLALDGSRYFFYVGDADWRKNYDGMLGGLAHARATHPGLDLRLVWAAKLSPERRELVEGSARAHGVSDALDLLGYVDDDTLMAIYRGAIGTLFVSRSEGFGLPVVESMAVGCPVITSNVSCLPEVAGDAALTVDPTDHRAIGDAMVRLATRPDERTRLTEAGLERAKLFGTQRQAVRTLDVYERLLHRHA